MRREEDHDFLLLDLVAEGLQSLPDVVGERLDQLGVSAPAVDHAPPHLSRRIPMEYERIRT